MVSKVFIFVSICYLVFLLSRHKTKKRPQKHLFLVDDSISRFLKIFDWLWLFCFSFSVIHGIFSSLRSTQIVTLDLLDKKFGFCHSFLSLCFRLAFPLAHPSFWCLPSGFLQLYAHNLSPRLFLCWFHNVLFVSATTKKKNKRRQK